MYKRLRTVHNTAGQLNEAELEIQKQKATVEDVQHRFQEATSKIEQLTQHNTELSSQISSHEFGQSQTQETLQSLEAQLAASKANLNSWQQRFAMVEERKDVLQAELEKAEVLFRFQLNECLEMQMIVD